MESARMVELLRPFMGGDELTPAQVAQLQGYLELLLRWNARTNLTAVRDEQSIVTRHMGESLFAARHALPGRNTAASVIDVGSGAGFPGLPLKIYAPGVDLTLIESQNKKATFLKEVIRSLHLERVRVFVGRAESFDERADLVTMRGVEHFESATNVAASLVRKGADRTGRLVLLVGEVQVERAKELLPELSWAPPVRIPLSSARAVLIGETRVE